MSEQKVESVTFEREALYTVAQVAMIMHRHPQTIRDMCRTRRIRARLDRAGYLIPGWGIVDYIENRSVIGESCDVK